MITYGPMLAIPICIVYGIVNKKRINSIIIVIITIIIGLTAGLRRELVVVLISCIFGWLIDLGQKMNKLIKQGLIGICLIIFMYPIYNNLSNIIKVNSPFIYYRIIDKTEKLLNGEGNEGDNHRLKLIVSLFTQYDRYLVPYGFINKQYIKNVKDTDVNGDYNDLPILELNRMLGSPLSTIIILYFVIAIICVLSKIRRNQISRDNIIIVVGGIIMLVLLFLEGSYFTFPYCAPYTGYILGKLQHESRLKIILHTNN